MKVKAILKQGDTLELQAGEVVVEVFHSKEGVMGFIKIPEPARGPDSYRKQHFSANFEAIHSKPLSPTKGG